MTASTGLMQVPEATSPASEGSGDHRIVLRNTMYLGAAEVLSMPLSIVLNAMMGRYLGPEEMGHLYLAWTVSGLAFLIVGWGHHGPLPAMVMRDKSTSGTLLGTSAAFRLVASFFAYAVVATGCLLLGMNGKQQWAIGLAFVGGVITTLLSACQDVVRGFERTDVAAYARVGTGVVSVLLVIPTLLLGGRMRATLLVQAAAALVTLLVVMHSLRGVGVGKLALSKEQWKRMMIDGTPFVFFGLTLYLQPNVDAFYLAKLTSPEVVGWYAVSAKLIGFLIMPATALIGALYPTLCRLHLSDGEGFRRMARDSITTISLLVVPVALGCALFPDIGISIFGRDSFRPAEDTLRLASIYLFLVYFSMPIGTALVAAGRAKQWTTIQLVCVLNSALLDPFFIRHFHQSGGNGGMGLCVTQAISETVMVGAGIALMPRGVFDRGVLKILALAALSGAAMAGLTLSMRPLGLPSLVVAPVAVLSYALALYLTGALTKAQVGKLVGFVQRKILRK